MDIQNIRFTFASECIILVRFKINISANYPKTLRRMSSPFFSFNQYKSQQISSFIMLLVQFNFTTSHKVSFSWICKDLDFINSMKKQISPSSEFLVVSHCLEIICKVCHNKGADQQTHFQCHLQQQISIITQKNAEKVFLSFIPSQHSAQSILAPATDNYVYMAVLE